MDNKFLWGASTSGFQVEGGYQEGGKGLGTTDVRKVSEGIADTKVASDHFHHYQEDILLMKELGLSTYRFSFCWSRIMPDGWHVNTEGLDFYEAIIDLCISYNIEPIPTLYHFEMPQALVDTINGWQSRECIEAFEKYARICFNRFKGKVKYWITINEQLIVTAASDLNGNHEPDKNLQMKKMYQMSYHLSLAEKKAMSALKEIDPSCKIGVASAVQNVYPKTSNPLDILASMDAEELMMYMLLDMSVYGKYSPRVEGLLKSSGYYPIKEEGDMAILNSSKPDFIGINYYSSLCVQHNKERIINHALPPFFRSCEYQVVENTKIEKTEWMALGIDPLGLRTAIYKVHNRYHLPMLITENGMAYSDELYNGKVHDPYRIDYLSKHIKETLLAKKEGYPIFGYCPWSFIDLVSSHQGFKKRYGLVYVDRTDTDIKECKRYKKDSFYWYQNVIATNGKDLL